MAHTQRSCELYATAGNAHAKGAQKNERVYWIVGIKKCGIMPEIKHHNLRTIFEHSSKMEDLHDGLKHVIVYITIGYFW